MVTPRGLMCVYPLHLLQGSVQGSITPIRWHTWGMLFIGTAMPVHSRPRPDYAHVTGPSLAHMLGSLRHAAELQPERRRMSCRHRRP